MPHELVVLGDLVADLVVPVERLPILPNQHGWAEGIFVEPGGAGNILVAARRVNLSVATLGSIGSDHYGTEMLAMLRAEGVDVDHVLIDATRQTVLCMVLSDRAGQHVYLGIKDGHGRWPYPAPWDTIIQEARALFTDGYTLRDVLIPDEFLAALATARGAAVPIFFDPGPSLAFISRELCQAAFALVDVLLLTDDEAALLGVNGTREEVTRALLAFGPSVVVLKHGPAGCTVMTGGGDLISHPGFRVKVVDTVGAGDSFAAAFIAGYLRRGSWADCATLANAMGALTTTQRGAGTRIPAREALLQLLANEPSARALA